MEKRHRKLIHARGGEIGRSPIVDLNDALAESHEFDVTILVPLLTEDAAVADKLEQIARWLRKEPLER